MSRFVLTALAAALLLVAPLEVAIISTPGPGEVSELRFQRPAARLAEPVASFSHVAGSTVHASLLPGTRTVLAIAQTVSSRDTSWAASLLRLEPGKPAVQLASRVAISTRPLVTRDGRVFVQRSTNGQSITIDEVNPKTGALRAIHTFEGHLAFIAGAYEGEVLVYRVGRDGADLVAVHRDALGVRVLTKLTPMARDFVVSGASLIFTTADADGWLVAQVDLKSGAMSTIARSSHVAALPTLVDGRLALCPGPGEGLRSLDGKLALLPRGPGFERVVATAQGLAFVLHELASDFPRAYATELKTGKVLELAAPPSTRLDVAGVVE
ncbi:MAG: hypothetical protein JNK82_33740 [Myxococcaceae bacterium]|nr:hypothetical protein [Myxococcaceae bacterium]